MNEYSKEGSIVAGALIYLLLSVSCATTKSVTGVYYKVKIKPQDTLAAIAARFDTTWQQIVQDNQIEDLRDIQIGQVLIVKPGPGGFVAGSKLYQQKTSLNRGGGFLFDQSASAFMWPLRGPISSMFGKRDGEMHTGIDIRARKGTKILAAARGKVKFSGTQSGYGKTVVVDHGQHRTLYAHCDELLVDSGNWVEKGQPLALVGETGRATGPHLHFEIRNRFNQPVNPMLFLRQQAPDRMVSRKNSRLFSSL